MASLIKEKKANTLYYYVVESACVDGKPRIVHLTYLGTAESVARLVQDRTAPVPLSATTIEFGLPGALWLAAEKSGVFALLQSLWPKPRSGPSPAHYLLLAAIHRICQPGPKTEVANWYRASILSSLCEELLDQLRQIQKYTLLYPPQGSKGPNRVATVLSKQSLMQQSLAQVLGLDLLGSTQRG